MTKKTKAILFMILSACSFSVMQLAVKLSGGIPMMQQVFVRNFFTLFIGFYMAMSHHVGSPFGKKENQKALFFRGVLGYLGVVMYFYASRHMYAADATLLHRSSPFFVVVFSWLFLKEKLTKVHVGVLIAAMCGAICVIRPSFNSNMAPALIGALSAASAGGAYTIIGYLKGKEDNGVIIFYFSLISCIFSLPFMIRDFVMPDGFGWFMLFLIGTFASLGQIFLTFAYKNAPAGEVSIYNFSGIICSSILGYLVLGEVLDLMSWLGMIIIITAALVMFLYNKKINEISRK